uniref:Putative secreted protein n=1 Tax=Anopheles darlingi TaxID=43151 RepID=A0A2M4D385_ANODA
MCGVVVAVVAVVVLIHRANPLPFGDSRRMMTSGAAATGSSHPAGLECQCEGQVNDLQLSVVSHREQQLSAGTVGDGRRRGKGCDHSS